MWFTPLVIGLAIGVGITYLCTAADRHVVRAHTATQIRAAVDQYVRITCRDVDRPEHPRYALAQALPALRRICDTYATTGTLTGATARAHRQAPTPTLSAAIPGGVAADSRN